MEHDIKYLLELVDRYCQETGKTRSYVSRKVVKNGRLFDHLEAGGGCTVKTFEKVLFLISSPGVENVAEKP